MRKLTTTTTKNPLQHKKANPAKKWAIDRNRQLQMANI